MSTDDSSGVESRIAVERAAVRVLPVNDRGQVLLLQGFEPSRPDRLFWFSVGGGLEDGEDDREAAVRETAEETGIVAGTHELLGPLLRETVEFSWGRYDVTQRQSWWAVRVGDPSVTFSGLDDVERATTVGHRWWAPEDLASSGQAYAGNLFELMRKAAQLVS